MARALQQHCTMCGRFTVEVSRFDLVDHEDVGQYIEGGGGHLCDQMDQAGGYGREPEPEPVALVTISEQPEPEHRMVQLSQSTQQLSPREHPVSVYIAGLSKTSRSAVTSRLELAARALTSNQYGRDELPWWRLEYRDMVALRAFLVSSGRQPSYVNLILSTVRAVLKTSRRLGLMTTEQLQNACDVEKVPGSALPAGRHVEADEFRNLMAYVDGLTSLAGIRDAAMIATLYTTGLRRFEAAALSLGDLDVRTGDLTVRHAKLGKQRQVRIAGPALTRITRWLSVRGSRPGALFCVTSKQDDIYPDRHLVADCLYQTLVRRVQAAGVKHFSPHSMRRTWVGTLLDEGADISTVAKAAGHSTITQTARYDRRDISRVRNLANLTPDF